MWNYLFSFALGVVVTLATVQEIRDVLDATQQEPEQEARLNQSMVNLLAMNNIHREAIIDLETRVRELESSSETTYRPAGPEDIYE